jgi:hypothetical protein
MSTNIESGEQAELIATGAGAISLCLVAIDGAVACITRVQVSGSEDLVTRMELPLSVDDGNAPVKLIPVVVYQSNPEQKIRIMGLDHARASLERSRSLGCTALEEGWRANWEQRERDYWGSGSVPAITG